MGKSRCEKGYFNDITEKKVKIFKLYRKFIEKNGITLENKTIVDVRCGTVNFILTVEKDDVVNGFDISGYSIGMCKTKFKSNKNNFHILDFNKKIRSDFCFCGRITPNKMKLSPSMTRKIRRIICGK